MICHAACDHQCPCRSFLNNSFFSCKDRALERDRAYQREKKKELPPGTTAETSLVGVYQCGEKKVVGLTENHPELADFRHEGLSTAIVVKVRFQLESVESFFGEEEHSWTS